MAPRRLLPGPTFVGFIVAVFAVLAIGLVSYFSRVSSAEAARQMARGLVQAEALSELLSTVKDAETGQRGYLLTGEDTYLEPFAEAQARLETRIAAVRATFAGDIGNARLLEEMAVLITENFVGLQQTVELRRRGQADAAMAIVRSGRGKNAMSRIRSHTTFLEIEAQKAVARSTVDWKIGGRVLDDRHVGGIGGPAVSGHDGRLHRVARFSRPGARKPGCAPAKPLLPVPCRANTAPCGWADGVLKVAGRTARRPGGAASGSQRTGSTDGWPATRSRPGADDASGGGAAG